MHHRIQERDKNQKTIPSSSTDWGMSHVRPFIMQMKMRSQLPDLKTSLSQAERYGHHLDKIQPAGISTGTPIQMLSAEEEEKKRMPGVDLGGKLTGNKDVLDTVFNIKNGLKKLNNSHKKDININFNKHFAGKNTSPTETSTLKNKDNKNSNEHLTSPTHNVAEKAAEEPSLPHDPEVKRLLNKGTKNNLPSSGGVALEKNQENFIAPPSIYNENQNTKTPKAGTHGQFLAKKEAMNTLGDRKLFAATQLAVKIPIGDIAKSKGSKAKDNQQQMRLKNAAELVRNQVIKDDRQVKEHLRGTLNLEPDIVAKQGGEQLILHKIM